MIYPITRRTFVQTLSAAAVLTPPSPSYAENDTVIRIGTPGNDAAGLVYYANDAGFFKKYGLNVDVQTLVKGSGAANVAAVAGRSLEIAEADLDAIAAARAHGINLAILAPSGWYNAAAPTTLLVVAEDSSARSAKDLEGKTVAVPSLEGPSRVAGAAWLDQNGVSPDRVKFVEAPPPEMPAQVAHHVIDAAIIPQPSLARALAENERVLAHCYDALGKQWLISGWFASADWVTKNLPAATKFVKAMRETAAWANNPANHPRTAEILLKYSKISPDLVAKMTRATYTTRLDPVTMRPLLDAAVKYRILAQPVVPKELISPIALANL